MSGDRARELESLRRDGESEKRREEFRASARAVRAWDAHRAPDLEAILAWIDALRALFGDPPTDRRPWRGDDHRL